MTTDPGQAGPPRPLHEMTTEELSRSRYQLERALQRMTAEAPGRAPLQQRLTAVRAIARIFAGLFTDYDLHNITSGYIALPKGQPGRDRPPDQHGQRL